MGFLDPIPTLPKHKKTIAQKIFYAVLIILGGIVLLWGGIFLAAPCGEGVTLAEWLAALKDQSPFRLSWNKYTPAFLAGLTAVTALIILYYACEPHNYRFGIEHGSSRIATVEEYNKELMDKKNPEKNLILSQNIRLALNTRIHYRNLNIVVIAGSGKGKTLRLLGPNLMEDLEVSYVITDPKKEVLTKYGKLLKKKEYRIVVIDLIDFEGDHYNPLAYIHTERELVRQVTLFLKNTTPKDAKSDVPFWEKAENTLWMGLFFYVWREFEDDPARRNFCSVIDLLSKAVSTETDEKGNPLPSELQEIVLDLEQREPNHPAVRQLKRVLFGAPDTVNSIVQMAQARAAALDIDEVRDFLSTDSLDIPSLGFGTNYDGETKTAVFLCVPEDDPSYNFLAAMVVDQITQELKRLARKKNHGKLPIPVMFFLDEAAQFPFPKDLIQTLSVARSYQMLFTMIYQDIEQIHTQFGDSYKTLLANMDHILYLGGNSQETNKFFSDMAGEQTLDKRTSGQNRSPTGGGSSLNYDAQGRHLIFPEELRTMPFDHCVLFSSGLPPCTDTKYRTWEHPNYHLTANDNYENEYFHDPEETMTGLLPVILLEEQLARMGADSYRTIDIDDLLGTRRQHFLREYTVTELIYMVCHGKLDSVEIDRLQAELGFALHR